MKRIREHLYIVFFACLLIFFLTSIWFNSGYILAAGEGGIFFYNFNHILHFFGSSWFTGAIGFPGTGLPLINVPFFISLNLLHTFGLSYVTLQQGLFFFLETTGFLSVFYIAFFILEKHSKKDRLFISLIAALFYTFNQINIVIVLNRMQYSFLFSYALIPLGLLSLIYAIKKKQILFAFVIPLITFFFATAFSEISSIILFWVVLISFFFFHFLYYQKTKKFLIFASRFILISILGWLFINSWWILPMAKTLGGSPYVTKLTYNPNGDLSILASLSQVLGNLSYIFRLMHHDFYIWVRDVWYGYYQNPIIVIFTFLIPAFVFGSLLVKKKFSYYYFFIFMSLFSVFFMKGIADPFGEIFQLLFTHVRILEAFRNPFEKISIILPLFYALPFALGVYGFYTFTKKRWSHVIAKVATVAICVICFVVLGIPIWNGWVFTGDAVPSNNTKIGFKVQVPLYYKNASSWLDKQTEDYRVVALPLGGEGITYNWMYGYTGVEPSNGIFDKSFISYCTTIQFLCSLTQEIQTTVLNNPNDVWKMLSPLHSNYIMVRKDSNYQIDQMQNPSDLQNKLDVANNIQKVQSFGPLTFYSGNKSYDTPKIFAATQGIYIDGENSFISALPLADYKKNDVYFTSDILQDNTLSHSHQIVLQAKEFVPPQLKISKENALLELPYVRFLPGSPFYLWTRWRENFDNFLAGSSDVPNLVVQSDKRLVEAYKLLTLGKRQTADSTMGEYVKLLNYFYDNNIVFSEDKEKEDLLRQKYVLDDAVELGKNVHDTNPAYDRASYILNALLMDLGLNSLFPSDLVTNRVYEVNVPREGNYTVKIAKEEYKQYYPMDSLSGVIDEKKYFSAPTDSTDPFIIIGVFYFSKGQHQIAIQVQKNKNLFSSDTIRIKTKKTSGGISKNDYILPVKNLNPNGRYLLSFDYKIIAGNPFQLAFIEDTDITKNGIKIPHYNLSLSLQYTGRFNSWYHYEYTIIPNKISHNAHLLFQVYPTNQCEKMNLLSFLCNNSSYSQKFNQISEANIKNISLVREDIGNVFLTKDQTINSPYKQPHIVFTQKNSARYMINVSGATTPFYLTFLEAYHPLWRLYYLINGKKVTVNEANHLFVNSYANAWLLDKKGNYSLLLEFSPQSFFEIGTKISIMTFSILVTVMGIYIGKKLLKKKQ